MKELASKNLAKVIDVLTERLAFERAGVHLYDAVIPRLLRSDDPEVRKMSDQMVEQRDEEKEHEEWLEAQIRALGGDPHAETDLSILVERESRGIESVILDGDPDVTHLFHALLAAELADHAGWDLLVDLASEAGDRDAKREFKHRLREEEDHLSFVKRALERMQRRAILGEDVRLPTSP